MCNEQIDEENINNGGGNVNNDEAMRVIITVVIDFFVSNSGSEWVSVNR